MIALSVLDQFFGDWLNAENKKNLLALFVVIKFFVVIGIVAFLVWTIRRNAARQCPDTSRLLDELDQGNSEPEPKASRGGRRNENGWERDPEWWKNKV